MTMTTKKMIFGEEAPKYYEKGISVIPLREISKAPALNVWSRWNKELPPEVIRNEWVASYPYGNIGLPLGAGSNMSAIDIDSHDPKVQEAIKKVLPDSPWARVGAKGCVLMFKYNPKVKKSFKIYDSTGASVVEGFINSGQVVLPPSIHPDTMKPYFANTELYDCVDFLQPLPDDIEERLRVALSEIMELSRKDSFDRKKYISAGGRDNAVTSCAGTNSVLVRRGVISVLEAIQDIEGYIEMKIEDVKGDSIDVDKAITNFLAFLRRDVLEHKYILPLGWDKGLTDEQKKEWGLDFGEDQQEWDYKKILEHLKENFETTKENSVERREGIDFIVEKIAKSPSLDDLDVPRILDYIHKNAGDGATKADYNKKIKNLKSGPLEGIDHTEIARDAIKQYEERVREIRYVGESFWGWYGDHWKVVEDREILELIALEYGKLPAAKKYSDHKQILSIMSNLIPQKLSDKEYIGVNFYNGFLDTNLKLHDHKPEHGMTYVLPYKYDPEKAGKFPKFSQLLHSYWSEDEDYEDKVRALQEAMCATIFGVTTRYQRAFLLYGMAGSGKSQLLDIIKSLVPQEARCVIKPVDFGDKFSIVHLHKKLINIAGELPEKGYIPGHIFKEVVVGEPIQAGDKHKANFTFEPSAAHWFSSNHYPKSLDKSEGWFRRWMIFDFERVIPTEEKILDFGKMIVSEEIEAIVAWAASIYPEFKDMKEYTLPKSHFKAAAHMEAETSSIRAFLMSANDVEYGMNCKCKLEELYQQFFGFIAVHGYTKENPKKFEIGLKTIPKEKRKFDFVTIDGETWCVGIKVKG